MALISSPLVLLALAALAAGAVLKNGVQIPTYAEVCKRNSPRLNECLRDSLETLIKKIGKNGIKELHLTSLEPIYIPEITITSNGASYRFKSTIRNVNVHGVTKVKIQEVRTNLKEKDDMSFEFDLFFPKIFIQGNYKTEGIIADIPVGGKGVYNISMTEVQGTMKVNGQIVSVDGEDFFNVVKVTLLPEVGNLTTYWENLIDGNPELTAIANMFFNQFWRGFYPELLPYTADGMDRVWRGLINKATLKIPFDQLLPPQ